MKMFRVAWAIIRPGFPGLSKHSNPVQAADDFTGNFRDAVRKEKELRAEVKESQKIIDKITADYSDSEMYRAWMDGLGLEQQIVERGLWRRQIFGWILIICGVILLGYSIGLGRGLYQLSFSIFPLWISVTFITTTAISMFLRGVKFQYHVWCIKQQELPSFRSWMAKAWKK